MKKIILISSLILIAMISSCTNEEDLKVPIRDNQEHIMIFKGHSAQIDANEFLKNPNLTIIKYQFTPESGGWQAETIFLVYRSD